MGQHVLRMAGACVGWLPAWCLLGAWLGPAWHRAWRVMGSGWLMTEPSLGAWMAPGGFMADKQHGQRCTVNQGMGVGRPRKEPAILDDDGSDIILPYEYRPSGGPSGGKYARVCTRAQL